jgi:hypothetical protein
VNYLPVNAAPVVDDLVVVPGARLNSQGQPASQSATVNIAFPSSGQNAAIVDDGSSSTPLQASKDRTAITVRWAAHDENGDDLTYALYLKGDGETVWRLLKDKLTEKAYSFDADLIPDGGYQIKVVASDAPSHTPGDALTGDKISERFEVDTTPPVVSAGPWQYIEPVGRLSDSRHEHYDLRIFLDVVAGKMSEHLVAVRVYDRHDNVGVAKTVIAAEEK